MMVNLLRIQEKVVRLDLYSFTYADIYSNCNVDPQCFKLEDWLK